MPLQPPKNALRFLRWFCRRDYLEEIEGDLIEIFDGHADDNPRTARRKFWWQVLLHFRPDFIRSFFSNHVILNPDMILNTFKQASRTLTKNRIYTSINVIGLALAMVSGIFVLQYVRFETSYDTFHPNADQVFRVATSYGETFDVDNADAMNSAPFGPAVKDELAIVKEYVRLAPEYGRVVFQYGEKKFDESKVYWADNSFFDVFGLKLTEGDPQTALNIPNNVVLSLEAAERYFGAREDWQDSPIGKTLRVSDLFDVQVSGVLEKIPANTHLKFSAMISFPTFIALQGDPSSQWDWNDFYAYLKVEPGVSQDRLQSELDRFAMLRNQDAAPGLKKHYLAQPLPSIHLESKLPYETEESGDKKSLGILMLIGIFMLAIAWANFVNLATAKANDRSEEVGVRKILGAGKRSLMSLFMVETFLINLFAGIVAFSLILSLQPWVDTIADQHLDAALQHPRMVAACCLLAVFIGTLVSGIYPAIAQLRLSLQRSRRKGVRKKAWLRGSLILLQNTASIVFIICAFMIFKQLRFMQSMDVGFSKEQKLVLKAPPVYQDSLENVLFTTFRKQSMQLAGVDDVAASGAIPGRNYLDLNSWGGIGLEGSDPSDLQSFSNYEIDDSYMNVYGLEVLAGEPFARDNPADDLGIAVSESAMRRFGLKSPSEAIGQRVDYQGDIVEIRSVFRDYHHKSPHYAMEPMILWNNPRNILYYTIKYNDVTGADISSLVTEVESIWRQLVPNAPFDYFFYDDQFDQQFKADQRLGQIVLILCILAIIIACIGLLGLTSYMVIVRRKEIGVRKVLGASVAQVVGKLSMSFMPWIGLACLVGIPLAIILLDHWLDNFTYHTTISVGIIFKSIAILTVISLLSVSAITSKAASENPAEVLCE